MTPKDKEAQADKIIRIFRVLQDMDLDGIPLITFEEYEKAKSKKEHAAVIGGIIWGAMLAIMTIFILTQSLHIKL